MDVSYQVSVHLAKRLQRRKLKENRPIIQSVIRENKLVG
jgi:hypothetical protein